MFTSDALDFMLDLTAALSLIPYLLAAAYALKLTITRETYGNGKSSSATWWSPALATFYTLFLIYAAGPDKLLLSCILYAPGAILYVMARRERNLRLFTPCGGGAVRDHCARRRRGHRVAGHRGHHDLADRKA